MDNRRLSLIWLLLIAECLVSFGTRVSSSTTTGKIPMMIPKACSWGERYSVINDPVSGWTVRPGQGGIATALICQQINQTGWDFFQINTFKQYSDDLQAFGAGFLEGWLTARGIVDSLRTFNETTDDVSDEVEDFIIKQDKWMRDMARAYKSSSNYWAQVGLVLTQFDGLYAGFSRAMPNTDFDAMDLLLFNMQDEIGDIDSHFQAQKNKKSSFKPIPGATHCSSLVKLTADGQQLFASHNTWSSFTTMLRQYKYYNFEFSIPTAAPSFGMSGYPGCLQSTDDFYITSANLVVMETTNDVMNDSLYIKYIIPQTVAEWVRILVANRMATSGQSWVSTFFLNNSGTYNNQWQIIDYKLFTPGQPLKPGTLWIAEQIPGYLINDDKTNVLSQQGYWPSYNIPYFPFVYNISGYPEYYKKYGNVYSYDHCSRANIFRREQSSVKDLEGMQRVMRFNKYQTDPLSLKDACKSISARCDLNTPWEANYTLNGYTAFGAIDCKVTDHVMARNLEAIIVNGPTWESQPPFAWTEEWMSEPHYGQPKVFAFDWVGVDPVSLGN